ncbi:MAG: dipeptidyl-peptidase 4 [Streptosporangiaceae bacterium]|nr:dipeptidyl-peptidase 4 [Streptosporangiaceae bacterium]
MTESFPRQQARTQRFTLGAPRSFQISRDGSRVAFLRSQSGTDPVTCLWVLDIGTGQERLVADPATLDAIEGDLPVQEKARRERTREQAGGIVAFATDTDMTMAAFALAGQVYVADLANQASTGHASTGHASTGHASPGLASPGHASPGPQQVGALSPALDPRPDPTGKRVAYVCQGALRVVERDTGRDTMVAGAGSEPGVTFGLAEFIASEEMGRMRGYWWAPDGSALLVARVDEAPVNRWYLADPANPQRPATEHAYPAAGTPNADVSLLLVRLGGDQVPAVQVPAVQVPVNWNRAAFPYLVTAHWQEPGPLIVVQSRDQRRMRILSADPASGETTVLREDSDERWLDIVPGVPARTDAGRIVWTTEDGGARRLLVATPDELRDSSAAAVTPPTLQVRQIVAVDGDFVLFTASQEPMDIGLWLYGPPGLAQVTPREGVFGGQRAGGTTLITTQTLAEDGVTAVVLRDDPDSGTATEVARIRSLAERPNLPNPQPLLGHAGQRAIRAALLLPSWHEPGSRKLPVLLDPYGGPHAQRVLAARAAFLTSQWLAEQGFAVLVADGRGTPGRGPEWEREVWRDLAGPVLEDQIEALDAANERCGDLDLGRVAIRGWSFGGYLAALAVLRRPDVFHAAIAGAPVTDWRLYDTHYTERYLGDPAETAEVYEANSLLGDAPRLKRPLFLIHGLADDNVVAAHTLRLSSALLAAGRPHVVLPLSGVTHMTPQEEVAENLLLLQVDFLRRALGINEDGV